jgi:hypothetical protein
MGELVIGIGIGALIIFCVCLVCFAIMEGKRG